MRWKRVRVALGEGRGRTVTAGELATCEQCQGESLYVFQSAVAAGLYGQCVKCGHVEAIRYSAAVADLVMGIGNVEEASNVEKA